MRRNVLLRAAVLALVIAMPLLGTANGDSRSAQVRAELSQLRQRIDKVREKIAATSRRRSKLSKALNNAQARIGHARRRLATLDRRISQDEKAISGLKKQRDAQRASLSGELAALRAQVRAAYETGRMSRLRLLLSDDSPARIGRMLSYYRYFSAAESQEVAHLKSALASLAAKQQALETARQQLAHQRHARAQTLAQLRATRQKQKATLAALDSQLSSKRHTLASMQAQQRQLKQLLDQLHKKLSGMPPPPPTGVPFYHLKGRMRPPVTGKLLATYGQLKNGGPLRWQGEWFAAAEGTPVHAVAGGRVVYVGYMKGYGLIVIVDQGHGYYALYGHAAASYVDVGDQVSTGQPIASAGHSGGHRRNGIYFEIRHGQTPVDPAHWLAG